MLMNGIHVLEKSGVTVWYSAPTAFRMLMAEGDEKLANYDLSKIRHILSVGEPLNPEVIRWGIKTLSNRIHDTWWMTETGLSSLSISIRENYPRIDGKTFSRN